MFLKSDGTEVWLKSSARLPYLSLAGVIETSEDYTRIRRKLCRAYEQISGIASDDAFLVRDLGCDGALVFCARPDKNCALLLLGKFNRGEERRTPCTVLEKFYDVVGKTIDGIGRQSGATIRFDVLQLELAMHAG
ncbi:hypothetical protein EH240_14060 [Mesorhizobium tamadayense]|uniref:Uncharacterized protein n=1 Tax=Mesorhizobium tamadayense TaxID=425306 RepID=A0A3P3FT21_9HYPH|nr:hypothetical protein [Mesorhizobium tamadayense]RRI01761.1 hypothetical protein EH240_14060 [Mesorhizobium tamadayense]